MWRLPDYIDIARSLLDKPPSKNKHFSFIVKKNRIRSIGFNNTKKTSPLSYKYNPLWPYVHSEVSAVTKFDGKLSDLENCILINVRLDKQGKVMMSKPCKNCLQLVANFGFKKVFYTGRMGQFIELK